MCDSFDIKFIFHGKNKIFTTSPASKVLSRGTKTKQFARENATKFDEPPKRSDSTTSFPFSFV